MAFHVPILGTHQSARGVLAEGTLNHLAAHRLDKPSLHTALTEIGRS